MMADNIRQTVEYSRCHIYPLLLPPPWHHNQQWPHLVIRSGFYFVPYIGDTAATMRCYSSWFVGPRSCFCGRACRVADPIIQPAAGNRRWRNGMT